MFEYVYFAVSFISALFFVVYFRKEMLAYTQWLAIHLVKRRLPVWEVLAWGVIATILSHYQIQTFIKLGWGMHKDIWYLFVPLNFLFWSMLAIIEHNIRKNSGGKLPEPNEEFAEVIQKMSSFYLRMMGMDDPFAEDDEEEE